MRFGVYFPPAANTRHKLPALTYLAGLTCTEENVTVKAGAQRCAAEAGLALVMPDTSPRGLDLEGEHDDWDFGSGAGFYVNATESPWKDHYRMYDYVTEELPAFVASTAPIDTTRAAITGHSMGGHGALVIVLRNPERYASISAFACRGLPTSPQTRTPCSWARLSTKSGLPSPEASTGTRFSSTTSSCF